MDDLHDQIRKEVLEEDIKEETQLSKRLRRIFIVLSSLLLLLILLIFIVPPEVLPFLVSYLQSYSAQENTIYLGNNQEIFFVDGTLRQVVNWYIANQAHETKMCLQGRKENNRFIINEMSIPKIFSQSFSHVTSEHCPRSTIISLHTHPNKNCFFSSQDISNLQSLKTRNRHAFLGVMCDVNQFNFFGQN